MKYCYNCGSMLAFGLSVCRICGVPVTPEPEVDTPPVAEVAPVCEVPAVNADCTAVGVLYYVGFVLLYSLPLVGLIASIAMAIACRKNQSKQNLAKAFLFFNLLSAVLCIAAGIVISVFGVELRSILKELMV